MCSAFGRFVGGGVGIDQRAVFLRGQRRLFAPDDAETHPGPGYVDPTLGGFLPKALFDQPKHAFHEPVVEQGDDGIERLGLDALPIKVEQVLAGFLSNLRQVRRGGGVTDAAQGGNGILPPEMHEIPVCQQSDGRRRLLLVPHDDEPVHVGFQHRAQGIEHAGLVRDRDDGRRHEAAYGRVRRLAGRYQLVAQVPIREQTHQLALLHHGQRPDALFPHQLGRLLRRGLRRNGHQVRVGQLIEPTGEQDVLTRHVELAAEPV